MLISSLSACLILGRGKNIQIFRKNLIFIHIPVTNITLNGTQTDPHRFHHIWIAIRKIYMS
jgi:hypothetical protein